MNRFKKFAFLLIGLLLTTSLIACSPNKGDKDLEKPDGSKEDIKQNEVDDNSKEDKDDKESSNDKTNGKSIDEIIDSSDYIVKVKVTMTPSGKSGLELLDSIKGDISNEDLPIVEGLKHNSNYVLFLKNQDGNVVLTDEEEAAIILEGDNHELYKEINKKVNN